MTSNENAWNRFFHQTLPSWNPKLTIKNTAPIFIAIGIILVIMGTIVSIIFRDIEEIEIDYTYCKSTNDSKPEKTCAEVIGDSTLKNCSCEVRFNLTRDIKAPVNLYYGLTNFYQNHRSYVSSKDNKQLIGDLKENVSVDCYPYDYVTSTKNNTTERIAVVPCGAIANSMFNDILSIVSSADNTTVPLIYKNITWPILKTNKFRNPPGDLKKAFEKFAKPKNWQKNIWELDQNDPTNNGFENEDFIVWMLPATLSNFKKLYRRINHTGGYNRSLPKGEYILKVKYSFPTSMFNGTKRLVIANSSILGTKNLFIAMIYIITGLLCLIIALVFCLIQFKYKLYIDE